MAIRHVVLGNQNSNVSMVSDRTTSRSGIYIKLHFRSIGSLIDTLTYDLSRGAGNAGKRILRLSTTTQDILFSPDRSALVVIDMQNFFLHPALRSHTTGLNAYEQLVKVTIPACKNLGIDIIFVNWGLTDQDLESMPPSLFRSMSIDKLPPRSLNRSTGTIPLYTGLGHDMGSMTRPGHSGVVRLGRLLMRDQWNTRLYGELETVHLRLQQSPESINDGNDDNRQHGRSVVIHKNRKSGLWGGTGPLEEFITNRGITTLFFSGVNTDQCVSSTLSDAYAKGYDCIVLQDACGTTAPQPFTDVVISNAENVWGFVSDSDRLADSKEEKSHQKE